MKRAAAALRAGIARVVSTIGLADAFLIAGTYSLAVFASYISAAGPWLVVSVVSFIAGLAIARYPRRKKG